MSPALTAWRAEWLAPVSGAPIADALVVAEAGRIVDVGPSQEVEPRLAQREHAGQPVTRTDLGRVALMPPLVNAHTHLELSWMKGRLPAAPSLPQWATSLVRLRATSRPDEVAASAAGVQQSIACGTGVVGDTSNSLASCGPLSRSPLRAVVFHELLGFSPDDPAHKVGAAVDRARDAQSANVDVTLAAHAPYSVAPSLFREIACAIDDLKPGLTSVHLAESPEEVEFLRTGSGPWRELLELVGTWTDAWDVPRCSPVEYLERVGFLRRPGVLVAHGVQLTARELEMLAERQATVVTCPRSNARLRVGTPPVGAMLASGVNLAIGTDSLASNDDLNVFGELAALRALVPDVPARRLLQVGTSNGARALRVDHDYGTVEVGKRAALIAVRLPAACADVEEFLLRGIDPSQIEWVRA